MMSETTPMDELNALLEERGRYEQWLAQLNSRRETTPAHVFDRVRGDYAARLGPVMEQLRSRAEGLLSTVTSLEEKVGVLSAEESVRRDARAEIELRAMVGEYSAERANSELATCDEDIGRIEGERTAAQSELARLQEILALVRQPAPRAAAAPSPASRPLGAPPSSPDSEAAYEELAFLNSVVDSPVPAPMPAAPPPRIQESVPLVTSLGPIDRHEAHPSAREQSPRVSVGTPAATPAFLKDMPTEQVKTLKCQECGTMNYPTEWYCERCGGELAAM